MTFVPVPRSTLAALGLALSLAGCATKKATAPPKPPVPVVVSPAARADVPVVVEAVGTAQARTWVEVRSRVSGLVQKVAFQEGADVKRGDVLFEIDRRPAAAAVAQAEGMMARDKALAENARADVARLAPLLAKDYVTREQSEATTAQAAALEAVVQADAATLADKRLDLANATIRAPMDGRTGELLVHEGSLVKADDAKPLVIVRTLRPIDVSFVVPESSLPEIRRRMAEGALRVDVAPRGDDGPPIEGELSFVDNAVEQATGTILLKASVVNTDGRLWPGEFVDVRLRLSVLQGAIVVPSQAVQTGQQGVFVYVVGSDGGAQARPVKLGPTMGSQVVVLEGLQEGDSVVIDGQLQLGPGSKVEVKGAEAKP